MRATEPSARKRVFIIGNAPNIIDSGLGEFIDNCDEVIRMNRFVITGHEVDVGTKCTIYAGNWEHYHYSIPACVSCKEFWYPIPRDESEDLDRLFSGLDGSIKLRCISRKAMDEVIAFVPMPTTGIRVIFMAMERFQDHDLYVGGFNFKRAGHYYNVDVDTRWPSHDANLEDGTIKRLMGEGKLINKTPMQDELEEYSMR